MTNARKNSKGNRKTSYSEREETTLLSAFHFKLEDGCKRFERDVKTGKAAKDWDAASANHPTLGLVAIVASWKATVEAVCGKPWLFEDEEEEE